VIGVFRLLVRLHGILYLHLYRTSVIIKFLNKTLKLNFLTVYIRHKTVLFFSAILVMYGISGALEKLNLNLDAHAISTDAEISYGRDWRDDIITD